MTNNYNTLAPFYQRISRLVFGKSLLYAQSCFLSKLKDANTILILGGGSGEFLPRLLEINPHIKIDYVEPSARMIKLCQKKLSDSEQSQLHFHQTTFQDFSLQNKKYDAAICFFFFDIFLKEKSKSIIQAIANLLYSSGYILVADFHVPRNRNQKILAKLMFLFLKYTTNIENNQLYEIPPIIAQLNLKLIEEKKFRKGFIFSTIWKKSTF